MVLWGSGAGSLTAFRLGRRLQSSIRSRGADQSVVRCSGAQSTSRPSCSSSRRRPDTGASSPGHAPRALVVRAELQSAGVSEPIGTGLTDAGYWHQRQMDSITSRGIALLIPPDADRRKGAQQRNWTGGAYDVMRRVLATEAGAERYRKRQAMIEPVFGHTKFNRKIDMFHRRGRSAARSEWRLITATHNLLKLHKHQIAATGA
jgi:Transposase DDE domain